MTVDRRTFLKTSGALAATGALPLALAAKPARKPITADTVRDILGGVRSTCTYVGASQLKELTKRTTFIRVREQENNVYGKE